MNIFSCKLYKSNKHKDKIRAAIEDPINKELLEQAIEYLDEEYVDEKYLGESKKSKDDNIDKEASSEDIDSNEPEFKPSGGGSASSFSEGFEPVENEDDEKLSDKLAEEEDNAEEVSESTSITSSSSPITITSGSECGLGNSIDLDTLLGTINSEEETSGAVRILIKNNSELWIYYNDSINLNNIMEAVISKIDKLGYTTLEFNRLARTDNAIVFFINNASSQSIIDSKEE